MTSKLVRKVILVIVIASLLVVIFGPIIPAHLTPTCIGRDCPIQISYRTDLGARDCDNILASGLYLLTEGKFGVSIRYGDPCTYL